MRTSSIRCGDSCGTFGEFVDLLIDIFVPCLPIDPSDLKSFDLLFCVLFVTHCCLFVRLPSEDSLTIARQRQKTRFRN